MSTTQVLSLILKNNKIRRMKKLLLFFAFLMILQCVDAQFNGPISNVTWEEDRVREEVIIMYDLENNEKFDLYNISVKLDKGGNSLKLNEDDLSNHKSVAAGIGNKIRWIVPEEYRGLPSDAEFVLVANGIPTEGVKKTYLSYVLGGIGVGSIIYGVTEMIPAKEDYDDNYVPRTNPDDPYYWSDKNTTRSQYYNEVNKRYKNGSWFVATGIGVTVAGVILNIRNKIKRNKVNGKEKKKRINKKKSK